MTHFLDRNEAGALLANALRPYADQNPVIYALPRGGLPVAAAVAKEFNAPLDLILVRKIGAPGHVEMAIGAVVDGSSPTTILHKDIIRELRVSNDYINNAKENALQEIERRRKIYLKDRPFVSPEGRTAIIVDDGLATGATMEAAAEAIRKLKPSRLIIATPVGPIETLDYLRKKADEVVCIETPSPFWAVGRHYQSFPQLNDSDVIEILDSYRRWRNDNSRLDDHERESA